MTTTIACVMPCFEMADTVGEAIESVLSQSRKPDEFVVVDDGSTDSPKLDYPGVDAYRLPHVGTSPALNLGVLAVESDWVQLVAADDRLGPDFLRDLEATIATASDAVGVISPRLQEFGLRENEWVGSVTGPESFRNNPPVPGPSAVRRMAWVMAGGVDPLFDQTGGEDWDLWCTLYENGWEFINGPMTYFYRVDDRPRRYLDPALNALLHERIRSKHGALFE